MSKRKVVPTIHNLEDVIGDLDYKISTLLMAANAHNALFKNIQDRIKKLEARKGRLIMNAMCLGIFMGIVMTQCFLFLIWLYRQ